ncbi:MAG TPA: hypothetical protein VL989_03115 [Candidatus Sulfotelmatobacter sp.]|nr:hypothetical protein [Candidatus Sulfotelmatobacter sp.]
MEDGYLRRNLSNGGQVNRDTFAEISMRAAQEVAGERSPNGGPYGGYVTGAEAPPYIPPVIAEIFDRVADAQEAAGHPEEAARIRLSDFDKAVIERIGVIRDRDAREAEYFNSHRFIGLIRRLILTA